MLLTWNLIPLTFKMCTHKTGFLIGFSWTVYLSVVKLEHSEVSYMYTIKKTLGYFLPLTPKKFQLC